MNAATIEMLFMRSKKARHVPSLGAVVHLPRMSPDGKPPVVRHIAVGRTARYALLGEPGPHIREVWIVCHGHAQLAQKFIERFRGIASPTRLIVAPEALNHYYLDGGFRGPSSKVGATWMTTEDRESEIADYVGYLDALDKEIFAAVPREQCTLRVLGFSQGVATAARWVAAGNFEADQVILWAGSLPAELTKEGAQRLIAGGRPLLVVAGEEDQYITPKAIEAQLASLSDLGVKPVVVRFPGGHEIDRAALESILGEGSVSG